MKTSQILLILLVIAFASCHTLQTAQKPELINQSAKDTRGNDMLIGKCTKEAMEQSPYNSWYRKNYDDYKISESEQSELRSLLKNKTITIFLGTWCGDSKREVPRMIKILEASGFPDKQLQLVMVSNHADMYKQSPQHEEAGKNIIRVPTLIIYETGKETGRIVESPVVSLENDMLKILRRESYIPKYSKGKL